MAVMAERNLSVCNVTRPGRSTDHAMVHGHATSRYT